ncbi:MAG: hypothetical protein CM15mP47_5100 [Methanobacteriota archaeon]|nr:MAG: hypothetical protein CM15mP47_5100 [Euryarchaeota archaeon]
MDFKVHIYDQSNNLLRKLAGPTSFISTIFEDNSNNLVVGSGNGNIYIYDMQNWASSTIDLQVSSSVTYITEHSDRLLMGTSRETSFRSINQHYKCRTLGKLSGQIMGSYHYFAGQISVLSGQQSSSLYYLDLDTDSDGVSDTNDVFPTDPTQNSDSDLDGYGDNPNGLNGDAFPDDATQFSDLDGDGYGDNIDGNNPDLFPENPTQNTDIDGDGFGDNTTG